MKKVNRLKVQNSFTKKIITIISFIAIGTVLVIFAMNIINDSMSNLAYDLGEKSSLTGYKDLILKNFDEYLELVKKYDIEQNLTVENFQDNNYIASFQEYDECSESKFKEVLDIKYEDSIKVTFKIYNKCGWCKTHVALHLIKIDSILKETDITYDYVYAKELNCGTVK